MSDDKPTAENPWPVRTVANKVAMWINRLGAVWVEGQVTKVNLRQGMAKQFMDLRDPAVNMTVAMRVPTRLLADLRLSDGDRVVVHGKLNYYTERGSLSLEVDEIRAVGVGELLVRIEMLRKLLEAEGLFDPRRKRRPPFLPNRIGLITGRASAAEHDVQVNALARWPQARFLVVNVPVQGPNAVPEIVPALARLDADPEVDVIVLARGGGSLEDLLPFSDETLCRAVARCRTPVLSAIGHEPDTPLVDYVADVRCSTPTDAGKRVVPDVAEELHRVSQMRERARRALRGWVDRERQGLTSLRSRPALSDPHGPLRRRAEDLDQWRERGRRAIRNRLDSEHAALVSTTARLTTLGPAATLARGYAVVQVAGDGVLRSAADAPVGTHLRVRLADGAVHAVVERVGEVGDLGGVGGVGEGGGGD
ncbi:exodeoxyribonuclease VII large subunit [Actinosynnema sp. NPDC020468]|uniref:exodeoxyribonuclease VII large subunit n=1 Tax=Actinosynnema sp. NPDC020468 TaxID=3154488 RepID=UPI0033F33D51